MVFDFRAPDPDPTGAVDMAISPAEFRAVADLVEKNFGIHLADGKRAMMGCRLVKAVRRAGCRSFSEFYRSYLVHPSPETLSLLANTLSTNHTYFNRESNHFWLFRDQVLPQLMAQQEQRGQKDLRVWCAAASTGEEPYTLAMMIRDALGPRIKHWRAGLLATDLSHKALEVARRGVYAEEGARELPEPLYRRYFRQKAAAQVEVSAELKQDVVFRRFNLMNRKYPFREPFQAVFCRNVLIYFEEPVKREVVQRIYDVTAPGGWLFVGHAETITGLGTGFQMVSPGVYRRQK